MTTRTQVCHGGFPAVEYYRDDDGDSGYGDHAEYSVWYGLLKDAPAEPEKWFPIDSASYSNRPDDFDLACERRHD